MDQIPRDLFTTIASAFMALDPHQAVLPSVMEEAWFTGKKLLVWAYQQGAIHPVPNIASLLFNPEGTHRFGLTVSGFTAPTYGAGYAFEEKVFTLGLGATYLPSASTGTGYAGIGLHWESYMLLVNYSMALSGGAGSASFGGGLHLYKGLDLAALYSSGLYSVLLNLSF